MSSDDKIEQSVFRESLSLPNFNWPGLNPYLPVSNKPLSFSSLSALKNNVPFMEKLVDFPIMTLSMIIGYKIEPLKIFGIKNDTVFGEKYLKSKF